MTQLRFMTAVAAAALLIGIPQARATLLIAAEFGGTTFNCADNQVGCDVNPTTGILELADQTINGVQVNGSIQTSTITATSNTLDTSSLSAINKSGANRTFTVTVGDTDFLGPVTEFSTAGAGIWQNAAGSEILLTWYNDPNNAQGAESAGDTPGFLIDSFFDLAVGSADAFSHNDSNLLNDPALFSMTLQASGNLVAGVSLLNRGQTEIKERAVVPEPASLVLLGSALAGLGLLIRRRLFSA
jgi:hypothetical protein